MDAGPVGMDPVGEQKMDLEREVASRRKHEGCADVLQKEESSHDVG